MTANAYALAAEDGTITLMIITPTQTVEFTLSNASDLADTLKRAMAAQRDHEMANAVIVKPQPKGVRIDGWEI